MQIKKWRKWIGIILLPVKIADPQKAIDRVVETYRQKGYPEEWIPPHKNSI